MENPCKGARSPESERNRPKPDGQTREGSMDAPRERVLQVGRARFDPLSGRLEFDGDVRSLRPRTAACLAHLVRHAGRTVTKDELMSAVWPDAVVTEDSLVQC